MAGVSTHLAIAGDGFFGLTSIDGRGRPSYVRDGTFALDRNGYLTEVIGGSALLGYPVAGDGSISSGALPHVLQCPAGILTNLAYGRDGTITVAFTDGRVLTLGRIALAAFQNAGRIRYGLAGSSGFGTIDVGALEQADHSSATGFMRTILAQRSYAVAGHNARAVIDIKQ